MTALVVHAAHWGNTRAVAQAIADGRSDSHAGPVQVVDVGSAPSPLPDGVDLVVLGGPTHAFSMSRENTRADAITRGASEGEREFGLREWVNGLPSGHHDERLATFDTRMRHLPGSAAKRAAKITRSHGYPAAAAAESFYVDDVDGPLLEGETERATQWGRLLATSMTAPTH